MGFTIYGGILYGCVYILFLLQSTLSHTVGSAYRRIVRLFLKRAVL